MDYENFKEQFTEDLKDRLLERGEDVKVSINQVNKLNESYEAITVTPEEGNIGVNISLDKFYDAIENGTPYEDVLDKAVETVERGLNNTPQIDVAALTDYSQMKEKLVMEVVSTESNKDMLENVPHKDMEDMSVVYRFVLDSNDEGRATVLVTNQILDSMGVTPECYPAFYLVLNHPTFNQIKKKHGINYSDKFYIRLLYAVSFVLSYSLPHKKIAGLTLEKSGLLLLTHR